MSERNLFSRIVHKHDIESNWDSSDFIPKQGELIVYDADENYNYERIKIGDGTTSVESLPFVDDDVKSLINTLVGDIPVSEQIESSIKDVELEITTHTSNNDIHITAEERETWSSIEVPSLDGYATEEYVENLYTKLNSNTVLGFYCIEDVTIVINGISKVYPANSNVEVAFVEGDTYEIIPTSNNSILQLNAFPGALGTYYPWLEGVRQFSNILFDMNDVDFYSKWSQGNQGSYQVQYAQYTNCIFWSDNTYVSDVSKRTNYTLYYTSQLPLCYSTIPDNTFKSFYLAFNVNSDPNWGNPAYRESFAKATWATQVFSYYGARTIGIFGHDDPDFNITLPKDCRGLMYQSTAIENAGTFDAINTTNFGATGSSWQQAFGQCSSLRNLYIKNLKTSINISWSPINHESIYFIISKAANTNAITISVSPYTYNLLKDSDFELATSKNITIKLVTTNYIEDRRLSAIADKADMTYVDEKISDLVNSAPATLDTLGELATAFSENKEVVDALNQAIVTKADITYVDEAIANIPTESDVFIVNCVDDVGMDYTFDEIVAALDSGKAIYATVNGISVMPLSCVSRADDSSVEFLDFNSIGSEHTEDQFAYSWTEGITIFNDNTFLTKYCDLLTQRHPGIESPDGEKDIVANINRLIENKKEKDLIVTYAEGSTFGVTHSSAEIYEAIQNGTTVYFQKGTELLNLMEITQDYATFFMFYINMEGKPQQKVVVISNNSIMLDQDDIYNYATTAQLNSYYNKTEVDNLLSSVGSSEDVLLKTEQTLTDAELTQVRSNLKFVGKDVAGQTFTVDGTDIVASANAEIFGDYASNIAVGQWSIAEGSGTVAKGRASHAEGAMTQALNDGTHTEGYQTKATGYWSHAEGELTVVSSYASHAEGSYCTLPNGTKRYGTAAGYASHIEGGGCHATGSCSHAEGLATTVSGAQSHTEGRYTIASGGAQHVEGIANVEDTEEKYIHIAGNGAFDARSNAHTLDWDGNAWFSGDVYIGSTSGVNKDDGSKKLATEEYVENNVITIDEIDAICGMTVE